MSDCQLLKKDTAPWSSDATRRQFAAGSMQLNSFIETGSSL